ncbi:MAG: UDP-N-acetylmuramoyl-L-alanine--D-glutamate ligase [Ferrovum sp.]|nr:UDP-N-acetylmuramoyl-L-alanine--D-glutamate ligase [Ferrovum sp.]
MQPVAPVAVLGLGDTGWAAVKWLRSQGVEVQVFDTRRTPPYQDRLAQEYPEVGFQGGEIADDALLGVAWVMISPGVPLTTAAVTMAQSRGIPVLGDVEVMAQVLASRSQRPQVVAVTGANGKSTVCTLLGAMARSAGYEVIVAGNIGTPVLEHLGQRSLPQVLVLELSSFQLETLHNLAPDAAVVLNVTEDHMDRYPDMAAYAAAKARIYQGCRQAVANRQDSWVQQMAPATAITFGLDRPMKESDWGLVEDAEPWFCLGSERIMKRSEFPLWGQHNGANALAALAVGTALGWSREGMLSALRQFEGLPHRVERVAVVEGVAYIDDSKGTNVGATVAALQGMDTPVILIAGGDGKGQDFAPLRAAVDDHARAVILIGRDGPQIARVLEGSVVPQRFARDLTDAVNQAAALAQSGDTVLMSPACASFDMFRHYVHRAEVFRQAVAGLGLARQGER